MRISEITCNRLAIVPMVMVHSSFVSAASTDMNPSKPDDEPKELEGLEEHKEDEEDLDDHNLTTSSTDSLSRPILEK